VSEPTNDYAPHSLPTVKRESAAPTPTFDDATGLPDGTLSSTGTRPAAPPGYELLEEVGHGGMGLVYRARHLAMNRQVAVKLLRERFGAGSSAARRFVEESLITGQLQHPAIPPVHEVGTLPNGRPFLAMKLILGRNLDVLLRERADPSAERGRFVAVFEQICQGVGYAHANGVIHRDLKPANVMVGAFAEVQVMDWGLAKHLPRAGAAPAGETVSAAPTEADGGAESSVPQSGIRTPHSEDTQQGAVMGTPAFMPPEQAAGEIEKIDARADVFGLGAVLCVILTGHAPYSGRDAESVRLKAVRGELDEALARIDACGAEPELIALCKGCLSVDRAARPADANAVARAVAGLRAAAEDRARRAELDRVSAELRATEQRKRRRVQLALAGAVLVLACAGGAFAWWQDKQATERARAEERAQGERDRIEAEGKATEARLQGERDSDARNNAAQAKQGVARLLALADDLRRQFRFPSARDALAQAAELAKGTPELLTRVQQAQRELTFVVQLDDARYRKWAQTATASEETRDRQGTTHTPTVARHSYREYRAAFARFDPDFETVPTDEAVRRVAASPVRAEIVAALEDWAVWEPDPGARARCIEVARRADPGPWTDRFRRAEAWASKDALVQLAAEATANPAVAPTAALGTLAILLENRDADPLPLLTAARAAHPANFELASSHARACRDTRRDLQLGSYEAARALRPDNFVTVNNLGLVFFARGDLPEAVAVFRKAVELDASASQGYTNLGYALHKLGDPAGAVEQYSKAVARNAASPTLYNNLGFALHDQKEFARALAAYDKAIELDPKFALPHRNRAYTLRARGDLPGAVAALRKAADLDPTDPNTFNNLGNALRLGRDFDGALTALNKAIELDPDHVLAHNNRGLVYHNKGDLKTALACYRKALELDPKYAPAQHNIGWAHKTAGDIDAAIVEYKKAAALNPKQAVTHFNLGGIYFAGGSSRRQRRAPAPPSPRTRSTPTPTRCSVLPSSHWATCPARGPRSRRPRASTRG
jgi:serine/threonine protein kinase/tetratricopeptide (TPR) repeat protein